MDILSLQPILSAPRVTANLRAHSSSTTKPSIRCPEHVVAMGGTRSIDSSKQTHLIIFNIIVYSTNDTCHSREHLYRNHRAPRYQCARCLHDFKTPKNLFKHQRQLESCQIVTQVPNLDLISDAQEARLKERGKHNSPRSNEEKWADIYKIIFPQEDVPSPCKWQEQLIFSGRKSNIYFARL